MNNTLRRILLMLIGVFMIVLGIGSFINPDNIVLAGGFGVILYGLGSIFHWLERKKMGFAKKTTLTSAILTIVVGVVILVGGKTGFLAAGFILVLLSLWLIVAGVLEIIGAVIFRKAMTTADLGVQAPGSIASMILGAILVLTGLMSLMEPLFAAITAGIMISLVLIVTGVRIVVSGIYSGILIRRES